MMAVQEIKSKARLTREIGRRVERVVDIEEDRPESLHIEILTPFRLFWGDKTDSP